MELQQIGVPDRSGWLAAESEGRELSATAKTLTQEYLAWGIHPESSELLGLANKAIWAWAQNGALKDAIRHWIPNYPEFVY